MIRCDESCPKIRPPLITDEEVMEGLLIHRFHGPLVYDISVGGRWERHWWHTREWVEWKPCTCKPGSDCDTCCNRRKVLVRYWVAPCWVTTLEEAERWWTPKNGARG